MVFMVTFRVLMNIQKAYKNNYYIFKHMGSFQLYIMIMLRHMGNSETYGNIYNSYVTYGSIYYSYLTYGIIYNSYLTYGNIFK